MFEEEIKKLVRQICDTIAEYSLAEGITPNMQIEVTLTVRSVNHHEVAELIARHESMMIAPSTN